MSGHIAFKIGGSYYEACNCEAICPCRRINGTPGGRSTYGQCDFLLNWNIVEGYYGDVDLSGQAVALAGRYLDDEEGQPWTVIIYVSRGASDAQVNALSAIFEGHAGGNLGFTGAITKVLAIKRANIEFSHEAGVEYVSVGSVAKARVDHAVDFEGTVSCGIPGHENPGTENVSTLSLDEAEMSFLYRERCGFATRFSYQN